MADLASLVEQHGFTLHFISHLTTPEGKAHEEGGRVLEKHFTGGRAIARWSHNLFALERDKQTPDEPTTFRILKERETGTPWGSVRARLRPRHRPLRGGGAAGGLGRLQG
jgi:twinkle protein